MQIELAKGGAPLLGLVVVRSLDAEVAVIPIQRKKGNGVISPIYSRNRISRLNSNQIIMTISYFGSIVSIPEQTYNRI